MKQSVQTITQSDESSVQKISEKIASIDEAIASYESKGLYGQEIGTAKLVRADRTFRFFIEEIESAKSGKAKLVELTVYVEKSGKPFAKVEGVTYIPNFALESNDVYWILENKVHGNSDEWANNMSIDDSYIPKEHKSYRQRYNVVKKNPEQALQSIIKTFKKMRNHNIEELIFENGSVAKFLDLN
jgi:hypothetical protein